jgi:hypothetical protein
VGVIVAVAWTVPFDVGVVIIIADAVGVTTVVVAGDVHAVRLIPTAATMTRAINSPSHLARFFLRLKIFLVLYTIANEYHGCIS